MVHSRNENVVELYNAFIVSTRNWSNEWNVQNEIGLSPSHVLILELLEIEQMQRPSKLAAKLHITTGGVTGLTNKLVKDGLIKRSLLEDDRRAICLEITDEGKMALSIARNQKMRIIEKMFGLLSDSEIHQLNIIFQKVNQAFLREEAQLE